MKARALVARALAVAWAAPAGCTSTRDVVGRVDVHDAPPSFTNEDAAVVVPEEAGLIEYCPSNKCPKGFTTCENSRFPCDVDLLRDRKNCGECGHACPTIRARTYECIEGRCVLQCSSKPRLFDCDGFDENGCETAPGSNDNCNACGDKCPDPAKPCVPRNVQTQEFGCGCVGDTIYCSGECVDPKKNDQNCGTCGNVCNSDDAGDGGPPPANGYFGCVDAQCGRAKCNHGYADCDGDPSNGCEAALDTKDNCAACGNKCGAGQECKFDIVKDRYACACPEGQTWCDTLCFGESCQGQCVDLSSNMGSCGVCGVSCAIEREFANSKNIDAVCSSGVCTHACRQGAADCNGNLADGCEVNTDSDPRNCGACGRACDAVAGQACVGGRCVVEPCEQTAPDGGETR